MESCSPTISTGGELTVKPFSIGGNSGTASAIQALATSVHPSEMPRRVFSIPRAAFQNLAFLDVALDRTAPHSSASEVRSHMRTAVFYRFLLFPLPSTGRRSRPAGRVASATVAGLPPQQSNPAMARTPARCSRPAIPQQNAGAVPRQGHRRRCTSRAGQTTSKGSFFEILVRGPSVR